MKKQKKQLRSTNPDKNKAKGIYYLANIPREHHTRETSLKPTNHENPLHSTSHHLECKMGYIFNDKSLGRSIGRRALYNIHAYGKKTFVHGE